MAIQAKNISKKNNKHLTSQKSFQDKFKEQNYKNQLDLIQQINPATSMNCVAEMKKPIASA